MFDDNTTDCCGTDCPCCCECEPPVYYTCQTKAQYEFSQLLEATWGDTIMGSLRDLYVLKTPPPSDPGETVRFEVHP